MVLIPEESMWFGAEGQTQCPEERPSLTPTEPGEAGPPFPRRSPSTKDGYGAGVSLGFDAGTGEVKAWPTGWPKPTAPRPTSVP